MRGGGSIKRMVLASASVAPSDSHDNSTVRDAVRRRSSVLDDMMADPPASAVDAVAPSATTSAVVIRGNYNAAKETDWVGPKSPGYEGGGVAAATPACLLGGPQKGERRCLRGAPPDPRCTSTDFHSQQLRRGEVHGRLAESPALREATRSSTPTSKLVAASATEVCDRDTAHSPAVLDMQGCSSSPGLQAGENTLQTTSALDGEDGALRSTAAAAAATHPVWPVTPPVTEKEELGGTRKTLSNRRGVALESSINGQGNGHALVPSAAAPSMLSDTAAVTGGTLEAIPIEASTPGVHARPSLHARAARRLGKGSCPHHASPAPSRERKANPPENDSHRGLEEVDRRLDNIVCGTEAKYPEMSAAAVTTGSGVEQQQQQRTWGSREVLAPASRPPSATFTTHSGSACATLSHGPTTWRLPDSRLSLRRNAPLSLTFERGRESTTAPPMPELLHAGASHIAGPSGMVCSDQSALGMSLSVGLPVFMSGSLVSLSPSPRLGMVSPFRVTSTPSATQQGADQEQAQLQPLTSGGQDQRSDSGASPSRPPATPLLSPYFPALPQLPHHKGGPSCAQLRRSPSTSFRRHERLSHFTQETRADAKTRGEWGTLASCSLSPQENRHIGGVTSISSVAMGSSMAVQGPLCNAEIHNSIHDSVTSLWQSSVMLSDHILQTLAHGMALGGVMGSLNIIADGNAPPPRAHTDEGEAVACRPRDEAKTRRSPHPNHGNGASGIPIPIGRSPSAQHPLLPLSHLSASDRLAEEHGMCNSPARHTPLPQDSFLLLPHTYGRTTTGATLFDQRRRSDTSHSSGKAPSSSAAAAGGGRYTDHLHGQPDLHGRLYPSRGGGEGDGATTAARRERVETVGSSALYSATGAADGVHTGIPGRPAAAALVPELSRLHRVAPPQRPFNRVRGMPPTQNFFAAADGVLRDVEGNPTITLREVHCMELPAETSIVTPMLDYTFAQRSVAMGFAATGSMLGSSLSMSSLFLARLSPQAGLLPRPTQLPHRLALEEEEEVEESAHRGRRRRASSVAFSSPDAPNRLPLPRYTENGHTSHHPVHGPVVCKRGEDAGTTAAAQPSMSVEAPSTFLQSVDEEGAEGAPGLGIPTRGCTAVRQRHILSGESSPVPPFFMAVGKSQSGPSLLAASLSTSLAAAGVLSMWATRAPLKAFSPEGSLKSVVDPLVTAPDAALPVPHNSGEFTADNCRELVSCSLTEAAPSSGNNEGTGVAASVAAEASACESPKKLICQAVPVTVMQQQQPPNQRFSLVWCCDDAVERQRTPLQHTSSFARHSGTAGKKEGASLIKFTSPTPPTTITRFETAVFAVTNPLCIDTARGGELPVLPLAKEEEIKRGVSLSLDLVSPKVATTDAIAGDPGGYEAAEGPVMRETMAGPPPLLEQQQQLSLWRTPAAMRAAAAAAFGYTSVAVRASAAQQSRSGAVPAAEEMAPPPSSTSMRPPSRPPSFSSQHAHIFSTRPVSANVRTSNGPRGAPSPPSSSTDRGQNLCNEHARGGGGGVVVALSSTSSAFTRGGVGGGAIVAGGLSYRANRGTFFHGRGTLTGSGDQCGGGGGRIGEGGSPVGSWGRISIPRLERYHDTESLLEEAERNLNRTAVPIVRVLGSREHIYDGEEIPFGVFGNRLNWSTITVLTPAMTAAVESEVGLVSLREPGSLSKKLASSPNGTTSSLSGSIPP